MSTEIPEDRIWEQIDRDETEANRLDLDAIEAMCEAATDGPWEHDRGRASISGGPGWIARMFHARKGDGLFGDYLADAQLMTQSRTLIPILVARVRELEAENEELVKLVTSDFHVPPPRPEEAMTEQEKIVKLATEVMGWKSYYGGESWWDSSSNKMRFGDVVRARRERLGFLRHDNYWNPYKNIAHAWMLWDKMNEKGNIRVNQMVDGGHSTCSFILWSDEGEYWGMDDHSVQVAISEAALATIESGGE